MPTPTKDSEANKGIQSVERALSILELLNKAQEAMSVSEISESLAINRTTIYGLLNTLIRKDYVTSVGSGKYTISGKMYSISYYYPNRLPIVRVASNYMIDLVNKLNLTVHLGILSAKNDVLLLRAQFPQHLQNVKSGNAFPIFASGMGKVILAYSPVKKQQEIIRNIEFKAFTKYTITNTTQLEDELIKIRKQGYSQDCEEYLYGVACMAFPIFNQKNEIIAAISITGTPEDMRSKIDQVTIEGLRCSNSCSMDMGWDILN